MCVPEGVDALFWGDFYSALFWVDFYSGLFWGESILGGRREYEGA